MLKNHVYGLGRGMITIDTMLITPNLWERANSVCVCVGSIVHLNIVH